jgi:imidazolonepropionase-like amidohydrolase
MTYVRARTLYTGTTVLKDAYLLFDGTTVAGVARAPKGEPAGEYPVVTPAFVDPHCHIGMERAGEPGSEGEANDQMDSLLFLADALDSVQMDDSAFRDSVEMGVLYSCVMPGSGNIVAGRSAVIRNWAHDTTEALVARAGIKAALGHNPRSVHDWKGTRPYTRMGALALLRRKLFEVRQKVEEARRARKSGSSAKPDVKPLTAEEEVVRALLEGRERLRTHVHKIDDIAGLLRLKEEFGLRVTVEHASDVHDGRIFATLKEQGVPVVFGPLDAFAYKVELRHENWRNLRLLIDSGASYGLMTDHPVIPQRNLPVTLRWFLRCGLSRQQAIEVITRRNAEILGIHGFLGTLEKGKWASFACWNGDPFDLSSWPVRVWGEGRLVYDEKHVKPKAGA